MNDSTVTSAALQRLKSGVRRFQKELYPGRKAEFEYAATHPQKPHTLFITCSDSQINVEDITSANSLEDVAKLHCGIRLRKAARNDFLTHTREEILSGIQE